MDDSEWAKKEECGRAHTKIWNLSKIYHLSSLNKVFTQVQCKPTQAQLHAHTHSPRVCWHETQSRRSNTQSIHVIHAWTWVIPELNYILGSSPSVEDWDHETLLSIRLSSRHLTPQPGMIPTLLTEGIRLDFSPHLLSHTIHFFCQLTILCIHRSSILSYERKRRPCEALCIHHPRKWILQHSGIECSSTNRRGNSWTRARILDYSRD